MDKSEIERKIETKLEKRQRKVVNRNAIQALFGAIADPVGSLGKKFLGRGDTIEAERAKIIQDIILDLVCNIDKAISRHVRRGYVGDVANLTNISCAPSF